MVTNRVNQLPFGSVDTTRVVATTAAAAAAAGAVGSGGMTVAGLPATPTIGDRSFVTDATANTFNTVAAGGGANKVPVFYDGAAWRIG